MKNPFKQIRFLARLCLAFFRRHLLIVGLGAVVGVLVFVFGPEAHRLVLAKSQRRIGLVGRFDDTQLPAEISRLVTRGLVGLSSDGTAQPAAARSWEVSQDGKVYKLYLKDDLLWQDGSHFIAKDVVLDLKNTSVEIVSDFQIKISLKEPFSPLPTLLSGPLFKKDFIGLGDYQITDFKKIGRFFETVKLAPLIKGLEPEYVYRFYSTQDAARTGFKLGEVDRLESLTGLGDLASWPKAKILTTIHKDRYVAIIFDVKNEKFKEKSTRQALAYGIKKEEGEKRAIGPISPDSWAYNPKVKPYYFDLAHAQKLLGETQIDSIELLTFSSLIAQAEQIKQDWESLGVKTSIRVINQAPDDFEALLAAWEVPADPDQYSSWHSTQKTSLSGIINPKIDKALEEGRKATDLELRKKAYWEFQKTLAEECPVVFLFHPTTYTISRY